MKDIVFIWIAIVIYAMIVALAGFVPDGIAIPFDEATFLLGASISGYTSVKIVGVSISAYSQPSGSGVTQETKDKLKVLLVVIYLLIIESIVVQLINRDLQIPIGSLLTMAGVCNGIILAGNQVLKTCEKNDGVK